MKKPEEEVHQVDLIWDDFLQNHLQFASKSQVKTCDETPHLLKFSKPIPINDGIFDLITKVK